MNSPEMAEYSPAYRVGKMQKGRLGYDNRIVPVLVEIGVAGAIG
jgi:hypothetical protein